MRRFRPPRFAKDAEHAVVYRRENEFASHPYVRGFWETAAGHLICNFSLATVDYRGDPDHLAHIHLVRSAGGRRSVTIRSEDRGRTWKVTNADRNRPSNDVRAPRVGVDGRPGSLAEPGPIDYTNRDVLLSNFNYLYMKEDPLIRAFYEDLKQFVDAPERQVFIRVSKDAGRTWSRSVMLPLDGLYSLAAIESVTVRPDGRALLFLNGVTRQGATSRPLVYRSTDDGTSFHFLSFITPDDESRYGGLVQMYPRGLMLPSGRLLCTLRLDRDWAGDMWTELYKSDDGGRTWQFLSRVNDFGAPGAPLRLSDGRLVVVYGSRLAPAGIRAIVSEDEGLTWGPEIIVRDDGGSWDVGYPRVWEAAPGRIGAIYYYNSKDDPVQVKPSGTPWGAGGVRFIARSFFSVD
ncbi:MAG TPA: sialidase family protein [Steroidobacteraceae bacterium]